MMAPIGDVPDQEEIDRVLAMAQRQGGYDVALDALVRMLPILITVAFENRAEALQYWRRISQAMEALIKAAYATRDNDDAHGAQ